MPSIEEIYDTLCVYKSIIVTGDDDDCRQMREILYGMDIDSSVITKGHVEDERPLFGTQLRMFHGSMSRALCISFEAWLHLRDDCGFDHNLLYLYNMEPECQQVCLEWIKDYRRRGFKMPGACDYYIGNEYFLINIAEQ